MLSLIIETWIWWAVVIVIAMCRGISRMLVLGSYRKLQVDDWIMLAALCTYTVLLVTINMTADSSTNLLPPEFDMDSLTPSDKQRREFGSKLVLVVEQCQILTVWAVKACILTMYSRLTMWRLENIAIKILGCYVAFGFVFMEVFYMGVWCRPLHLYWAVPTPNKQCNAATNHLITNAAFNLSSDAILLGIALPMFIRSKLPRQQKVALVCVFGLGLFVILCAILNKYYSFREPFGSLWTFWYVRESSTALLVANLPYIWTLFRRVFKFKALDSLLSQSRTEVPLSGLKRKGNATVFSQGVDPESGRKFSASKYPNMMQYPVKEDPEFQFITTPTSFADSWPSDDSICPSTPSKCLLKDSLCDRRLTPP